MDLVELGARLRQRRIERKVSIRAVARAAGISNVYLWALERAENPRTGRPSRPSVEVLTALARELELDQADLLGLAGYGSVIERSSASAPITAVLRRLEALESLVKTHAPSADSDSMSLELRPGDHVLLFVTEGAEAQLEVLRETVRAALENPARTDACVVRLEPGRTAAELWDELAPIDDGRLLLVEADEAWAPYEVENSSLLVETTDADYAAHRADAEQILRSNPDAVHVFTEDCSAFAAAIANPDVLFTEIEPGWLETEQAIYSGVPVSVVCLYKESDLREMRASDLTYGERLLELLGSHNRIAVLSGSSLLVGGEAASAILERVTRDRLTPDLASAVVDVALAHRADVGRWLPPLVAGRGR